MHSKNSFGIGLGLAIGSASFLSPCRCFLQASTLPVGTVLLGNPSPRRRGILHATRPLQLRMELTSISLQAQLLMTGTWGCLSWPKLQATSPAQDASFQSIGTVDCTLGKGMKPEPFWPCDVSDILGHSTPTQEWPHPPYVIARCSSFAAAGNQAASHPGCGEVQGSVFANPEKGYEGSIGALQAFAARPKCPESFRQWIFSGERKFL